MAGFIASKILVAVALATTAAAATVAAAEPPARPLRVLHVMSYHSPWRWTDGQLAGFKETLALPGTEYRVFAMDTKRKSAPAEIAASGAAARAIVESWKPDLIYTSDDDAQVHVTAHYLDRPVKQVFSGVNKSPATYGFDRAKNVTGVLEEEHFVESVRLLKSIAPSIKRLAVVLDEAPMWGAVGARMRARLPELQDVEIVAWDTFRTFADYQAKIAAYPRTVDGIVLLGIFNFKGDDGRDVPYEKVLRWTAENSRLPDVGFWVDRVHFGTLAAVTVSEREQGLAAGRLARAILVEGKSPDSLPISPTRKGLPVVSVRRAKDLGIRIPSKLLLAAEVVKDYEWEKQ